MRPNHAARGVWVKVAAAGPQTKDEVGALGLDGVARAARLGAHVGGPASKREVTAALLLRRPAPPLLVSVQP
eukprot:6324495-Prymnesium_polylepis.1